MSETFVQVPTNGSGEKIGVSQLSNGADNVDIQHIVVADDTTYAARAKVQNSDPASTDYGLTVRHVRATVSTYSALAAATNNAAFIKASAGTVFGWEIYNYADYPVFVKLYNKASAPAPASDNALLILRIPVQSGDRASIYVDRGLGGFTSGIGIAIVKQVSDTDNTSIAVNDCVVNIWWI